MQITIFVLLAWSSQLQYPTTLSVKGRFGVQDAKASCVPGVSEPLGVGQNAYGIVSQKAKGGQSDNI